jgi:hypothetical protein
MMIDIIAMVVRDSVNGGGVNADEGAGAVKIRDVPLLKVSAAEPLPNGLHDYFNGLPRPTSRTLSSVNDFAQKRLNLRSL